MKSHGINGNYEDLSIIIKKPRTKEKFITKKKSSSCGGITFITRLRRWGLPSHVVSFFGRCGMELVDFPRWCHRHLLINVLVWATKVDTSPLPATIPSSSKDSHIIAAIDCHATSTLWICTRSTPGFQVFANYNTQSISSTCPWMKFMKSENQFMVLGGACHIRQVSYL